MVAEVKVKTKLFSLLLLIYILSLQWIPYSLSEDYTQLNLPKGAKARLGKGLIKDIQISPDNKRLGVVTTAGVWLYDISTRTQSAPLIRFDPHNVTKIAFSPDSKIFAFSTYDKTIRLLNTETGVDLHKMDAFIDFYGSLKFTPDSNILISQNGWDGIVQLWNVNNGEHIVTFNPNLPKLNPRKFKNWKLETDYYVGVMGDVICAIGNKDGTISIKNGKTGNLIRTLKSYTYISNELPIQYSRPYNLDPDIKKGKQYTKWVNSISFAPDGKTLVSIFDYRRARWDGWSGQGGGIELWDVDTGEQLGVFSSWNLGIKFSGDGKTLAISGDEGHVIWDIASRRKIATFPDKVKIRLSGDVKTLAIVDREGYGIWDIMTQQEIASHSPVIEWLDRYPDRFVLSHDGSILATSDSNGRVALWETNNTKQLRALSTGYSQSFTAISFSKDGKILASGNNAGNLQLWDVNSGKIRKTIKTNSLSRLEFSSDTRKLISQSKNKKDECIINVWDIHTGEQIDNFSITNLLSNDLYIGYDDGTVLSIHDTSIFSPNGEKLAIETKGGIEIWDVPSKRKLKNLSLEKQRAFVSAFTPDGNILAVVIGRDVRLHDTQTGEHYTLKTPKSWRDKISAIFNMREFSVYALAFAHDGKTLAAGGKNMEVYLLDMATKRNLTTLKHKYAVSKLAFSPDNTILASGDSSGKIYLWEVATGRSLVTYEGHGNFINNLSFTPDGKTLASISGSIGHLGYNDGTIFLWDVPAK